MQAPSDVSDVSVPFLSSERLYLRGVSLNDVNGNYLRWMNDPDITRFLESRFFPHSLESLKDFVTARASDKSQLFLAIVTQADQRHIGNIKLGPIDWVHRLADIGLLIGEADCHGQGYASEAIKLLTDYAFSGLNLHKVTAGAYALNQGSIKAFQKAGYTLEGLRPKHFFCQGEYVDYVLLGRVREA